jgi:hypothetical protein
MSIEIKAEGVDVQAIMGAIRKRIEEKRQGLYSEEEIREIAEKSLDAVLDAHEFNPDFVRDFRAQPTRWNFAFHEHTIYESSRGALGRALRALRGLLRPIQKLFWNPNPMISALSRQSDLNAYYAHLLTNLAVEVTKLNLELQELKNRQLGLQGRVEFDSRRERTLEQMVVYRDEPEKKDPADA